MRRIVDLANSDEALALLGVLNSYAQMVDDCFGVTTTQTQEGLLIEGDDLATERAEAIWRALLARYRHDATITERELRHLLNLATNQDANGGISGGMSDEVICVSAKGRPVRPKTNGQSAYVHAIDHNELTFAIGPAGTGKTYLAVAMAVKAFKAHKVSRIILTRPAVEAGESLGFLPGDLQSKVDPYMRPLYDALYELMGFDQFQTAVERGIIEISPLAYMRGRTLDDAFIILDEAQNTTANQMKMFLTRLGFHSKAVVTGDITQIDLPRDVRSGLLDTKRILSEVEGVAYVDLTRQDVVRNPLVQKIITAYEKDEHRQARGPHMQKWTK